ncbi:lantibiotic dehydratase [Chryseobacterium sp. G0186]|uniref:lantibiotic dehydratase family protein n=1 Tax=Chryseobacterium sp. G0186 TaxID=2487064 RepID=UPI000F4FB5CD|nr:lantibiotic dehydratase family protein [Chryseobacterium sp. G0186]AZA79216.1 lantibiotic dehydratase [Chryseobacterium sp. G0186]
MSRFPYQFFDQYIFRSSLFSLKNFLEKISDERISDEDLKKICSDPVYLEAIYLASPYLHEEIEKWVETGVDLTTKKQEKLRQTILKYYNRISARATPFGLFAGVGLGTFGDVSANDFDRKWTRDTKLDMHFLVALSHSLAEIPEIKRKLLYFPNTSIYTVGRRIRYVEYEYQNGKRQYIISSVYRSQELDKVLEITKTGKTPDEIIETLSGGEITHTDAAEFVDELIQNQILVSQLEPNVSGDDFLNTIIKILPQQESGVQIGILKSIQRKLKELDESTENSIQLYRDIEELMSSFTIDYEKKFLFQTDLYFENTYTLPLRWKRELKTAIAFLNKITLPGKEPVFQKFKKAFQERFDTEEISLAYVMDTEIGIGYRQNNTAKGLHPYLDDLVIPKKKEKEKFQLSLNAVQVILNQKIQGCLQEGGYSIELFDEDFSDFEENWTDQPDTLSFMAELFSHKGQEKLNLYRGGGSTAAVLSARFFSEKSGIENLTKSITEKEKELNPDLILAEIVHLPEARMGNVIRRPLLRDYEIPYLAGSTVPEEHQIAINDLYISLKNDKVILRSKKYNKEVRPYLTNAHDYSLNSLPIYHFLSDLYLENNCSGLGFYWGDLKHIYRFLPRVEYKNIILEKARWQISEEDLNFLLPATENKDQLLSAFRRWRNKKRMPQWVQWIEWDNRLILNLENNDSIELLINTVQKGKPVIIEEFLHNEKEDFAYQFIFSLYKDQ